MFSSQESVKIGGDSALDRMFDVDDETSENEVPASISLHNNLLDDDADGSEESEEPAQDAVAQFFLIRNRAYD